MVLHKPLLDVPQTDLGYSLTRISRSVLSVDASNDSNAVVLRANRTAQTLLTNLGYPCCETFQMYKSEELWAKTCVRVEIVCCDRNVGKLVARCLTSHSSRCLSSGRCFINFLCAYTALQQGRGLTTHLQLLPRLRMSGDIPPFPLIIPF